LEKDGQILKNTLPREINYNVEAMARSTSNL